MPQEHTREPWVFGSLPTLRNHYPLYSGSGKLALAVFAWLRDAKRAAACVNGCKDIENPKAVPGLVRAAEAVEEWYSTDFRDTCAAGYACKLLRAALAKIKGAPGRGEEEAGDEAE